MSHTTANKGRLLLGLLFSQQGSAHKAVPERRCLSQGQTGMRRWSPGKLPKVGWDENSLRCLVCWSLTCQCFQRKMGGLIHLILTPWLTKNYSTPSYKLQADISQYSSYAFSSRDKSWLLSTSRKKLPLTISQDKHLSFQILNEPQKTFLTSRSFCSHIPLRTPIWATLHSFGHTPVLAIILPKQPWIHLNPRKFNIQFKRIIALCI